MSPFEKIYTYTIDRCPQLAVRNTHAIHEWIASGYDVEADILPSIEAATKAGAKTIGSFNYFSGRIRSANEKRIREQAKPKETSSDKDASRAAKIQWLLDKGLATTTLSESDIKWLEQYRERSKTSQ